MSAGKFVVIALGVAWLSAWTGGARANECADDNGCPKGFSCEVTGASGSCGGTTPAICPDGPDAGKCEQALPSPPSKCETVEYRSCVPGPCATDADCGTGMVCFAQDTGSCSSTPSAPCEGGICPPRTPPECTSAVTHLCVPRYVLPCTQASDCGEGFSCEATSGDCACAGSAGTGARAPVPAEQPGVDAGVGVDSGSAPPESDLPATPLPPADCGCRPSTVKACRALDIPCKLDTDCPGEFACQTFAVDVAEPEPACRPNADGGACDSAGLKPIPPPQPEERRCVPPYYSSGIAVGVDSNESPNRPGGTTPTAGGDPKGQTGSADAGLETGPLPPSAPSQEGANLRASDGVCSVHQVGSGHGQAVVLWAGLLSLAAACMRRRRGSR